jgi:hypothetical protein
VSAYLLDCNGAITVVDLALPDASVAVPSAIDRSGGQDARSPTREECTKSRHLALDGTDNAVVAGTSGVEVYDFEQPVGRTFFLRLRTTTAAPAIRLMRECDPSSKASALAARSVLGGAIVHGALDAGGWFIVVDWNGAAPSAGYKLDAIALESAPSCRGASNWSSLDEPRTGHVASASDTTAGCSNDADLGTVFYPVTLSSASEQWSFTLSPQESWKAKLQVVASCTTKACVTNTQVSSAPGQPATVLVKGMTSFLLGVGAVDPMEVGTYRLEAAELANCTGEGTACGTGGICCAGKCQPPTTTNGCGTSCSNGCASDAHGTASCSGHDCAFTCAQGYSQCASDPAAACQYVIASDVHHCGDCKNDCTQTAAPAHGSGWQCSSGVCAPVCDADSCVVGTSCMPKDSDPSNCGACGHDCRFENGIPDPLRVYTCTAGVCDPPKCTSGYCDQEGTCTAWYRFLCGPTCDGCHVPSWAGGDRTVCTAAGQCCGNNGAGPCFAPGTYP